ncbi:tRNA (5-methylaminomethyl-2-thiouridine)(34)-methyltransferase MnmD [Oceanicoccus sp. KOV_DT_Chl]|uniref:tRNA (5-methylaminomethyl-2-thiouridine)(34)-methyltransferase MnmD n=1 Tax=Oceanicoccus sp. KOV_DT_Chl TaxID=1904639 RepID=UPI000C7B71AD|nr:tRNA (5-methylaminomethyl-2-thiouridine)(34)-methyltransferase MnmD [Oceanicoccus sp. KOV_DT_Chl]
MPNTSSTPPSYQLQTAEIEWLDDDIPQAKHFNDIYFSKLQGLDETRYVFLQHNQLEQRWQQLTPEQTFTIAETGFGSGLNFLAAWQLWQRTAPLHARLQFVSVEKYPLKKSDLIRVLAVWDELKPFAEQLIDHYPTLTAGQHLIDFPDSNVSLLLIFDDAIAGLEQLRCSELNDYRDHHPYHIDAWFLDGFTPTRNPQLWNDTLYAIIADLSGESTSLATFTASSAVRHGLGQQGFHIQKAPGFGTKREMLTGRFDPQLPRQAPTSSDNRKSNQAPWYLSKHPKTSAQHITIIGGGLAGSSSAYAMAKRGWQVTLIERQPALAQGASGNPQGMLYTKLSPQRSTLNEFYLSSYLYALRFYQQWQQRHHINSQQLDFCGVMQLANSAAELKLMTQLSQAFDQTPNLYNF